MKKIIIVSCIALCAAGIMAKISNNSNDQNKRIESMQACTSTKSAYGTNPYTYAPQFFTAENGITGRFWIGNQEYPAKAYIEDVEYEDIIVIKKSQLNLKSKKKLRKHKDYLGFYINPQTNVTYHLYGVKKNTESIDDSPDSDVLTVIAIKNDYGIGE